MDIKQEDINWEVKDLRNDETLTYFYSKCAAQNMVDTLNKPFKLCGESGPYYVKENIAVKVFVTKNLEQEKTK